MSGTDSKAGGRDYLLLFLQEIEVSEGRVWAVDDSDWSDEG